MDMKTEKEGGERRRGGKERRGEFIDAHKGKFCN